MKDFDPLPYRYKHTFNRPVYSGYQKRVSILILSGLNNMISSLFKHYKYKPKNK